MILRALGTALALALCATPHAAEAVPQSAERGEPVTIGFAPPDDASLVYRWQKTDDNDGEVTMSWSVDRYRFEDRETGYRLTVQPMDSGSNERNPRKIRAMKKLEALIRQPYVLRLDEDAVIVELEQGDVYWSEIVKALRGSLLEEGQEPEVAEALKRFIGTFESMPAEVRLAQLTEHVQPTVEFAFTELSPGSRSPPRSRRRSSSAGRCSRTWW